MMLIIYGIKYCDNIKIACQYLTELGLAYHFHDYKKQEISPEKLTAWLDEVGQNVILNKKGTTWRKLTEAQQQAAITDPSQLIDLLVAQPSLIKRPVLETPLGLIVGVQMERYLAVQKLLSG